MKICPKCSTKNDDAANFCKGCGENLTQVPVTREETPTAAGAFFSKAKEVASAGAKKAQQAAADGAAKAKEAMEAEKERRQNAAKQPPAGYTPAKQSGQGAGHSWDRAVNSGEAASVTVKKYPFFQDEDENAVAVIGEGAAVSDTEGAYKMPYAVLTQRRLYCKNEMGNFITELSEVQALRRTNRRKGAIILWGACLVLSVIMLLLTRSVLMALAVAVSVFFCQFQNKKDPRNLIAAQLALLVGMLWGAKTALDDLPLGREVTPVLAILFVVIHIAYTVIMYFGLRKPDTFSIKCAGGTFSFLSESYSQQEISDFCVQAEKVCPVKPAVGSYQANGGSGGASRALKTLLIVIVLIALGIFLWYRLTHCKVSGCTSEVYQNGYCQYHYYIYKAEGAVHSAFDGLSGFFSDLFGN